MDEKVSVIVPVYNSAKYLPMCIESILNQTYKNLEIVLVDDGSKDDSLKICNEYACCDHRIKVIHQENRGVSAARNVGIEISTGEYITFVDSDDELLDNCIQLLLQDIEEMGANIATASQIDVTIDQQEVSRILNNVEKITVFSGTDALELSLNIDRRLTSCHGKLFCKKFIADIKFDEGKRINEDLHFVFHCCMKKPILTYRDQDVYRYYFRDNSASRSIFSEKYFDMLYLAKERRNMVENYYPNLRDMAICMEISMHLFMLNMLCKTNEKQYTKDEKESIRFVKRNYRNYLTPHRFEKRLAWIVAHGLYPIYKKAVRFKYYR